MEKLSRTFRSLKFRLMPGSLALLLLLGGVNPAHAAPVITNLSPARQMLNPGQTLNLSIAASGVGSLTYHWMRNGHVLAGITGSSYSTTAISYLDAGYYLVDVTDTGGTTRSNAFFVLVAPLATQVVVEGYYPGYNANRPIVVPPGLNDIVAASSGVWHTLLLRANGTVTSMTGPPGSSGETAIPTGLDNVVAVAAGTVHSLALRADGTVVGWGDNYFGEITIPSGLRNVVAIAANQYRSVALKSDGTVLIWGGPSAGGTTVVPAGLNHVTGITGALALKADGTAVALDAPSTPAPVGWSNIVYISSPQVGTDGLGVKSDGTVVSWSAYAANTPPAGLSDVISVSAGGEEVALKADGTTVHWPNPSDLTGLTNVFAVTSGPYHAIYLRDITGNPAPFIATQPADRTVVAGGTAVFSVTASGNPVPTYQWRKNGANIAGATSSSYVIAHTTTLDAGTYTVVVSNSLGAVTSNPALLTVSPVPSDFNGDSVTDIMLENQLTGQRTLWLMGGPNGQYVTVGLDLGLLDPSWHIAVVADFNGDGHPDILLESSVTGQRILWFMGGPNGQYVAFAVEIAILDPVWHIVGAADFDHDGHLDLLVENRTTGQRVLWLMQGADGPYSTVDLGSLDPVWQIVGVTDFNADGQPDILLENTASGQRVLWLMGGANGQYVTLGLDLGFLDPIWHIVGARDFNRDGHPDILLENTASGQRVLWLMGGEDSQYVTLGLDLGVLDPAWQIVH